MTTQRFRRAIGPALGAHQSASWVPRANSSAPNRACRGALHREETEVGGQTEVLHFQRVETSGFRRM